MHANEKPYKIWSCDRELRKAVIASSLEELKLIGASKLGYLTEEPNQLRIVLESDGTEVEDDQYFQLADEETTFLLLQKDEKWIPAGVEALKSAISTFPGNVTVVLQLDNRDPGILLKKGEPPWKLEVVSVTDSTGNISNNNQAQKGSSHAATSSMPTSTINHGPLSSHILLSSSIIKGSGISILPRSTLMVQPIQSKSQTSSSASFHRSNLTLDGLELRPLSTFTQSNDSESTDRAKMTEKTSSKKSSKKLIPGLEENVEESGDDDGLMNEEDDDEDGDGLLVGESLGKENEDDVSEESGQGDVTIIRGELSPNHDHSQCDFHCAALHRDGGEIRVSRSVATSPITQSPILSGLISSSPVSINIPTITGPQLVSSEKPRQTVKGHVRFMDTVNANGIGELINQTSKESNKSQNNTAYNLNSSAQLSSLANHLNNKSANSQVNPISTTNGNGSDSETETTEREDEQLSERYLLLVDQLTVKQGRHLNLKDIGIILERLSSKIIDVDKLEKEKEGNDCYNWIIKATIRGEVLREIGVIYNGNYYGIMEHPGYY